MAADRSEKASRSWPGHCKILTFLISTWAAAPDTTSRHAFSGGPRVCLRRLSRGISAAQGKRRASLGGMPWIPYGLRRGVLRTRQASFVPCFACGSEVLPRANPGTAKSEASRHGTRWMI